MFGFLLKRGYQYIIRTGISFMIGSGLILFVVIGMIIEGRQGVIIIALIILMLISFTIGLFEVRYGLKEKRLMLKKLEEEKKELKDDYLQ